MFDVLGWCSPAIIIPKMLIQRLWEEHLNWDELVSATISTVWEKWISKFTELRQCSISRSYFPKEVDMVTVQLHGFCDASEGAYAGAIYTRGIDTKGIAHISLVVAKTKVAPIKGLTIPRLELCGALIMARLLKHTSAVLNVPMGNVFAWTDSRVVLGWLRGDPRRFKVFVGNRVSEILELTPPSIYGGTYQVRTTRLIAHHEGCILINWPIILNGGVWTRLAEAARKQVARINLRANIRNGRRAQHRHKSYRSTDRNTRQRAIFATARIKLFTPDPSNFVDF